MAKNLVVIGLQWGDEGKGKVVDLLHRQGAGRRPAPGQGLFLCGLDDYVLLTLNANRKAN